MIPFSLCVGFRADNEYRQRNWDWCLARWRHLYPDAEICVADSTRPEYNRSEARNRAVAQSSHDIIVIADADVIVDQAALDQAIEIAAGGGWAVPYRVRKGYFRLTQRASAMFMAQPPEGELVHLRRGMWIHNLSYSTAGCLVMPRSFFDHAGWYDERYKGWGSEDWCFTQVLGILCKPHVNIGGGVVLHLWHPGGYADRQGQPHIAHNMKLSEEIVAEARRRAEGEARDEGRGEAVLGQGAED